MFNHLLMIFIYLAVFFFAQRQVNKWIHLQAEKKQVSEVRSRLITRLISYLLFFVTISVMAVSLGLGYQEVSLFVSSAFAVLGVGAICSMVDIEQHHCWCINLFCISVSYWRSNKNC